MPGYRIGNYGDADYDSLVELWRATGIHGISREGIAGVCAHGGQLIVAYDLKTGDAVGTVMWTFDGERAIVRKVAVHADYRRQGIAVALMEEARRQIREAGIKRALLFTGTGNDIAQKLYAKLGWTVDFSDIQSWKIVP